MIQKQYLVSLFFGCILLSILFARGLLSRNQSFDFSALATAAEVQSSQIKFTESASQMGIDLQFRSHWPNPNVSNVIKKLRRLPPSIAVGDLDHDGFQDLVVVNGELEFGGVRVYKNNQGKNFTDLSAEVLKDITTLEHSTLVALIDYDTDGFLDIVVGRFGTHSLYVWDKSKKKFIDRSEALGGYRSNPESVAAFDYNKDGRIDLFWGNYYPNWDLSKFAAPALPFLARGDFKTGGENVLLQHNGTGYSVSQAFKANHKTHTVTVGVSDINQDGFPDLFEGNEYAPDFLYLNENGENFKNISKETIPLSEHGFSSMNSEFFDYDFDGSSELYITNISAYPILGRGNILWKKQGDKYVNIADDLNIQGCGYAWTGKFADFDLNFKNELFVINGGYSGQFEKSTDYWFFASLRDGTPMYMRSVPSAIHDLDFNYSGYEKDCLFEEVNGRFKNTAEQAGIADIGDGRGMALADFDNNGLVDVVIANQTGPLKIYMNQSVAANHWVGFTMIDKTGSQVPYGAVLSGNFSDGRKLFRETYPLNGHNGQSDPRIVVAVKDPQDLSSVEVRWPDGTVEKINEYKIDQYNILRQKP